MVCIYTQMTRDDALNRLRDLLGGKEVSGNATGTQITLIRAQRYGNSILRPAFSASLESTERGCLVRGQFGLLKSARWFMIVWFVLAAIWIACTTVLYVMFKQPFGWLLPTAGLLVPLFGFLLLGFARVYYRSDREWIINAIKDAIRGVEN